MSSDNVQIQFRRGGRRLRDREFSRNEIRNATLNRILHQDRVAAGLNDFEVYVSREENEISAANMGQRSLEEVLQSASGDEEINGTYVIDVTVEHVGAGR